MSRVNVAQHIATLERLVAAVESVNLSALSNAVSSSTSLLPSCTSSSASSSASSSSSSSCASSFGCEVVVEAAAASAAVAASASCSMEPEVQVQRQVPEAVKRTLVHAFYQALTARKYAEDIAAATPRSDLASLARLQQAQELILRKLAVLEPLMNRVFSERQIALFSDPSVSLTEAERSMATDEQLAAFGAQAARLPAFVANLLREHQGAAVPITTTLMDESTNTMRFVRPQEKANTLFGKLIKAVEVGSRQSVAIKLSSWSTFIARSLAENPMREARMNQLLQPAPSTIVGVHEIGCDAENHWIVMEHIDGGDLFTRITEGGVSEQQAWVWMHQAVHALGHCHARRMAHMDVSAENFLLTRAGDLKLCDFGQARLFSVQELPNGSSVELPFPAATSFGTKLYCQPPEMVMRLPVCGTKVDMFSLGVVLYTLLQGCRPYQHGSWLHDAEYGRCGQGVAAQIALNARLQCLANQARPDPRCLLNPQCTFCGSDEAAASNSSCRISAGAAEVIARLLCLPELRATIDELLDLPWMVRMPGVDVDSASGSDDEASSVAAECEEDAQEVVHLRASSSNSSAAAASSPSLDAASVAMAPSSDHKCDVVKLEHGHVDQHLHQQQQHQQQQVQVQAVVAIVDHTDAMQI